MIVIWIKLQSSVRKCNDDATNFRSAQLDDTMQASAPQLALAKRQRDKTQQTAKTQCKPLSRADSATTDTTTITTYIYPYHVPPPPPPSAPHLHSPLKVVRHAVRYSRASACCVHAQASIPPSLQYPTHPSPPLLGLPTEPTQPRQPPSTFRVCCWQVQDV